MKTRVFIYPNCIKNTLLDVKKINFSDTTYKKEFNKGESIHFIDMYYKNDAIIIQLPRYKIKNMNNDKIGLFIDDDLVKYFIKPLEEYIIDYIHINSEKLFNGKKFTMNKITNCMLSPYDNDDRILNLTCNKNTLYFDRYKNILSKSDVEKNIDSNVHLISLIKIANLQFLKNKFTYNIIMEQCKVFIDTPLIEYSIIDDNESNSNSISSCTHSYNDYNDSIDSVNQDFFNNLTCG